MSYIRKCWTGLISSIALFGGTAWAAPVLNAPADVAAINALEQQNAAQLDPNKLSANYALHAVVLDYMQPGLYQGRAAIEKSFAAELAPAKSIVPNIEESSIVTDGQFACDAMTSSFQFVLKNGKTGTMSLRQIDALEKIDGRWQVVQEDISAPMNPKTGLAVFSGLPVRGNAAFTPDVLSGPAVSPAQADAEIINWANVGLRAVGLQQAVAAYGPEEPDALLYGEMAPGNVRGIKEITAYYGPVMGTFNSVHLDLPLLKANADGLLGAQIDIQDLTLHLNNGTTRKILLHEIDCLHRVGSKWYSMEEMVSFPVNLATGKSVTTPK